VYHGGLEHDRGCATHPRLNHPLVFLLAAITPFIEAIAALLCQAYGLAP
jgi:hypothetical protein